MCAGVHSARIGSERVVATIAVLNGIAGPDSKVDIYSKTLCISAFGIAASGMNFLIWVYGTLTVGMQACGDVMIGQHGRSVHEAIPHICGAKASPTSLLIIIIT